MKKESLVSSHDVNLEPRKPSNPPLIRVAFVCVHNSCRSQIAEALGKHFASDVFESYSGGTVVKEHINQDAVRLLKQTHGIDMEVTQKSKLVFDMPKVDIKVSMGCDVVCPSVSSLYQEDWNLTDPSEKSDAEFITTIQQIEQNILELKRKILSREIPNLFNPEKR